MRKEKGFGLAMMAGALLAFILISSQGAYAMTVWADHATVKILPATPAKPDQSSAHIKAAKNEFEPFQLIVTADQGDLAGVDVNVSDLSDGHGNSLPANSVMIYKEVFMNVKTPSTTQGGTGEWPDALIPKKDEYVGEVRNAFPFSVSAGRNQPVWIEIYVPPTAAAGEYSGSATVTADGQNPVVIPIQLTVWNFALPSVSTLKSAYSIDYHLLPTGHGLPAYSDPPSSDDMFLTELYAQANLLHRITDNYLPPPAMMGGLTNGVTNWGAFDAAFGPFLDGTVLLPGQKLPGNKMTSYQLFDYGHQTDIPYLKDYAQHFKSKGWFDRLFQYTCDEPPNGCSWDQIKTRGDALHQADPDLRALVTTSIQKATAAGVAGVINLLTPTLRYIDDKPVQSSVGNEPGQTSDTSMVGNQRSKYGPEVWWYQACGSHGCNIIGGGPDDPQKYYVDWPTYMIDLPAMFNRVMQWESFKYNVQGELYFDMVYAYGSGDPWLSQYYFGGNGDGTLYYPGNPSKIGGNTHIPIESIRLKLIREGMEDYEYMNLLKTLGDADYANQQVAQVVTNTYTFSKDPAVLYDSREKMADKILTHSEVQTAASGTNSPAGVNPAATSSASPGGGGGGGCAMTRSAEPIDFRQAASYLLIFFLPFAGLFYRRVVKTLEVVRHHR